MSLTSFLKDPNVKKEFSNNIPKPKFTLTKELLPPSITKHYSLVGSAFDYLLRFYVKYLNPGAVTREWIAEFLLSSPSSPLFRDDRTGTVAFDSDPGKVVEFTETDLTKKVRHIIEQAKQHYLSYLASGKMTDTLIESTLRLAQLEPIFRAGIIDENIGSVSREDVADLQKLVSIIDPEPFRAKEICMLNPSFNEASKLVKGADADLLIDDVLIDIKTTKRLELARDDFNQLLGYYILFKIGGITDAPDALEINRLGIYYSRHGVLCTAPVKALMNEEKLPAFIAWFKDKATAKFHRRHSGE